MFLITIVTICFLASCGSTDERELSEEERQEQIAKEKYKLCAYLAKATFNNKAFEEMETFKKIKKLGYADSECQRYYDSRIREFLGSGWRSKLKHMGKTFEPLVIDESAK